MTRHICLLATLAAMLPAAPALAGQGDDHKLTLTDLLGDGKDLHLYLRREGNEVAAAFGRARQFNRMPHTVQADGLRWKGDRLTGPLTVTIPSDGYVPPRGETLTLRMELDVAEDDGVLSGTCSAAESPGRSGGPVSGTAGAPPSGDVPLRLEIHCERTMFPQSTKPQTGRLSLTATFRDGEAATVRIEPPGSIVDTGYGANLTEADLKVTGGKLAGSVGMKIGPPSEGKGHRCRLAFAGPVIASAAAGSIDVTWDGKPARQGVFYATATAGDPPAGSAKYVLKLENLAAPRKSMRLYVASRGGKLHRGYGAIPNFNNATHTLDLGGVKLREGRLTGRLGVTVNPDPWVPEDGEPIPCEVKLDAEVKGGGVSGRYSGTFDGEPRSGRIVGDYEKDEPIKNVGHVTLKIEDGLFGGNAWHNRAFLSFDVEGGKPGGGRVWNNHTSLSGSIDSGRFRIVDGQVRADLVATVQPGGGVTPGEYRVKAEGDLVGSMAAGTFTTTGPGGREKTGLCWVSVRAAE